MTRDEVIKVLSSYDVNGVWADVDGKPYNAEEQAEAFDMAIEALLEAEAEWIPCSERLPENGYWLWSAKGGEVQKDFYWDGHWEHAEKYGYEVMAWMPLPKSYKGGDTE